jgi:hypothetical protein
MKSKLAIYVLVALSGSTIIASAQGSSGGGRGAATIPGAGVRAGEGRRLNAEPGTRTGYAMMRRERRTVGQPEPVTATPYINFDATEVAPAGR